MSGKKRTDITGKRYGKLVVLEYSHTAIDCKVTRPCWACLCDCGNTATVQGNRLKSGNTTSCGCEYDKRKERSLQILSLIRRSPAGMNRKEIAAATGIHYQHLGRQLKWMVSEELLEKNGIHGQKSKRGARPISYIYTLEKGSPDHGYINPGKFRTLILLRQFSLISTTTTIVVENPYAVAETHAATATPSTLCTAYQTAGGVTGQSVGEYVTVVGATNAANNGTFLLMQELASFIILANASGVTAASQQATLFINPLYGQSVTVSGFSNAGNNGTFTVASSTPQSLVLVNSGGVAETHAGTVVIPNIACPADAVFILSPAEGAVSPITSGTNALGGLTSVGNGDSIIAVPSEPFTAMWAGRLNSIIWLNVVEF